MSDQFTILHWILSGVVFPVLWFILKEQIDQGKRIRGLETTVKHYFEDVRQGTNTSLHCPVRPRFDYLVELMARRPLTAKETEEYLNELYEREKKPIFDGEKTSLTVGSIKLMCNIARSCTYALSQLEKTNTKEKKWYESE